MIAPKEHKFRYATFHPKGRPMVDLHGNFIGNYEVRSPPGQSPLRISTRVIYNHKFILLWDVSQSGVELASYVGEIVGEHSIDPKILDLDFANLSAVSLWDLFWD